MPAQDLRGTQEQGATFVELFFDLVFVFAVTQVAGGLGEDLSPAGALRALIVFWLVWWAWTQFTWSLNEADTENVAVRLFTLVATAIAFVMAVTVPLLTEAWGFLFPLSYLVLRVMGIWLQWRLARGDPASVRSVRVWTLSSSLGLLAVGLAVGAEPGLRYPALGAAALLDVVAALRAGGSEWRIFPRHFAERHGLFVIIALGESLIAAGVSAGAQLLDPAVLGVTTISVIATTALWWTYFGWVKDGLEERLAAQGPAVVGRFARDVYSFAHFPLICGVIGLAVAVEKGVGHPQVPLPPEAVAALVVGVVLIVGSTALAMGRAGLPVAPIRIGYLALVVVSVPLLAALPSWAALGVVAMLTGILAGAERRPGAKAAT
jgi:low temperature requirement protein LtrA